MTRYYSFHFAHGGHFENLQMMIIYGLRCMAFDGEFFFLFIKLFIQTYLYMVKTILVIGYFAYVPCFMTSIYIKYENTYLNNDLQ